MDELKVYKVNNEYTFIKKIILLYWWIKTKLFYKKVRIIRFPFDIRGKKYIDLGENFTSGIGCRLEAFSSDNKKVMFFGSDVQINDYVHICAMNKVIIGNNVLMAGRIYISDNSHGIYKGNDDDSPPDISPHKRPYLVKQVIIGNNVWLGEGVVVLPGVTIGDGSIIGANAVVSKSIPPNSIAVGIPAKVIKQYDFIDRKWKIIN